MIELGTGDTPVPPAEGLRPSALPAGTGIDRRTDSYMGRQFGRTAAGDRQVCERRFWYADRFSGVRRSGYRYSRVASPWRSSKALRRPANSASYSAEPSWSLVMMTASSWLSA